MFTGIIESMGIVVSIENNGSNKTFEVESALSPELKIDQSVSHNGVCLTVEKVHGNSYKVTAIAETLKKTNAAYWEKGSLINLERCLQINGRLDGHIVQGHVDTTATCIKVQELDGSWVYEFEFLPKFSSLIIEKGSICINGISFTVFDVKETFFSVAIIPYTYQNTNIAQIKKGDAVNIEFDMIGKYISKILSAKRAI